MPTCAEVLARASASSFESNGLSAMSYSFVVIEAIVDPAEYVAHHPRPR